MDIIAPLDRELRGPWRGYWLSPSAGGLKQDTGFASEGKEAEEEKEEEEEEERNRRGDVSKA